MKLTFILMLWGLMSYASATYSQSTRLTFESDNASIERVFKQIEALSEFKFAYNSSKLNVEQKISIKADHETIDIILDRILGSTDFQYKIVDRYIIITDENSSTPTVSGSEQVKRTVSGKVTDASGASLPGVSVVVKGTTVGVITDNEGKYSLQNITENGTLVFSFVGMKTQEVVIGNKSIISVTLSEETVGIEEVIAIGYGTMKKSDLTGSVSQIKSEAINAYPSTNLMQAIAGKSTGVQVLQTNGSPGSAISIRIRGSNSIQGSNEPLYVVDGFPVNNPTAFNNSDLESIEILKDASSTAIYGSRGANGVVLITTKKGKAGKNSIDFESSYSSQSLIGKLDLMNATEYASFYNTMAVNDKVAPYFTQSQIDNFKNGFDWQDFIYQTAPMINTALNVNGGNEKTKFSISGSTLNQDGIIKGSKYNRYSVRTNLDHQFSKKFSALLSGTFSRIDVNRKESGGGARGNTLIGSEFAPPTVTPFNDDGSNRVMASVYPFVAPDLINPLNFINEQTNLVKVNLALINAALIFNPTNELTLKISGGMENRDDRSDSYTTRNYVNSPGSASVSATQFTSLLNENTISYNNSFNKIHNIAAVAGFTYQDFLSTSLSGSGSGFLSDAFGTYNLAAAVTPGIPGSGYSKSVLLSYLGRINYNFQNKYFLTASYRADGSSKFTEGNKWGYFPSAALAWKISEEDFLKDNSLISNLKLRTSWGATGSQAIGAYVTLNQLSSGKTIFNDALYNTFAPGTNLPGNLKWETTEQMNIGFDLGVKKNILNITADYYVKNTKDLLNTVILPSSLGFTSTIQNVGQVQNRGFEIGLDAQLLSGIFSWSMNANISFNRNKVIKLYNGADILGGNVSVLTVQDNTSILREGRPIGQFFGYKEDGYDNAGKIKYQDLDLDGKLTAADKSYIGDPNPDFIYGVNSNMTYKGLELNIVLQGTYGNDLFNASAAGYAADYVSGLNMIKDVFYNSWTPTNTNAKYPIISKTSSVNASNRFIEDGSFLRLKNVQLAYNIPVQKLGLNKIQTLQFYISGQNLLTFTKYSGSDPEVNSQGFGIDNKSYPMSKATTIGVRARF